jgi:hypothetical protein
MMLSKVVNSAERLSEQRCRQRPQATARAEHPPVHPREEVAVAVIDSDEKLAVPGGNWFGNSDVCAPEVAMQPFEEPKLGQRLGLRAERGSMDSQRIGNGITRIDSKHGVVGRSDALEPSRA